MDCLIAELAPRRPGGLCCCDAPAPESREDELDAATWAQVFREAAALGVKQALLAANMRRDLVDIAAHAREAGLATTLLTYGTDITRRTLHDLWEAGLAQIQVPFADADAVTDDRLCGVRGGFQRKHALVAEAVRLGLPLIVVADGADGAGIEGVVGLAHRLRAHRVEVVDTPGGCADRLGRAFHVTAAGRVLPCQAGPVRPVPPFWSVREHSIVDIWARSPAFAACRSA